MKIPVTAFNAEKVFSKVPVSPYNDKTYIFSTHEVSTPRELFQVMTKHFILNFPLTKLTEPVRTFRRKSELGGYQNNVFQYIILDVDDVTTAASRDKILEYFSEFTCILGASRSYNGIDNFRLKGVLFVDGLTLPEAKKAISFLAHELVEYCELDESAIRQVSYNAPIENMQVFLDNDSGNIFSLDNIPQDLSNKEIQKEYIIENDGESVVYSIVDLQNIEADTIENLCLKIFQNMGFEAIRSNFNESLTFKHPTENKSVGGYFWFSASPYTMHHPNTTKSINIFDSVRKMDVAKDLLKQDINYDDKLLKFDTSTKVINTNNRFLKVSDEIAESVHEFIHANDGLFSIKSPMGTGKSTIIGHIIEECHEEDLKVLIITNRISVAQDFSRKYNLKLYNRDKYEVNDSLVVQYDSLWKYNIRNFDVIVMDEFISLMLHSRSNLSNSAVNIAKFFASFSKKLVIADAFLTGYENFLLKDKTKNNFLINNEYRDSTTLLAYEDYNYFIRSIIEKTDLLKESNNSKSLTSQKITISATSLAVINELALMLRTRGLRVVTLTADTPDTTKDLIYDLFEKEEHDKWDVLIFSPTLTVGVSNLNNGLYHFHYDSSMSSDVISSLQMIKRTRKAKEIHLFLRQRINYIRTSYNEIRDEYMANLGKSLEHNYLFEIDNYGEPRLSDIGKKAIKIDTFSNILEFNHREAFLWLSKYHFLNEPRIITKTFEGNPLSKYKRELKDQQNDSIKMELQTYLELNEIQKMEILDTRDARDAPKVLRILAEIDSSIKECSINERESILNCALSDSSFINKCKFYHAAFNFTNNIWDTTDLNNAVHKAITSNENDDIKFFNALSRIMEPIRDSYIPKSIRKNRDLRYVLDACGYSTTKMNSPEQVGYRGYNVNPDVKRFYYLVK